MESETADAELMLNNATQRLQRLEQDVTLLRDKALNVTLSTERTNQDAAIIEKVAEEVKKVSSFVSGHSVKHTHTHTCRTVFYLLMSSCREIKLTNANVRSV